MWVVTSPVATGAWCVWKLPVQDDEGALWQQHPCFIAYPTSVNARCEVSKECMISGTLLPVGAACATMVTPGCKVTAGVLAPADSGQLS